MAANTIAPAATEVPKRPGKARQSRAGIVGSKKSTVFLAILPAGVLILIFLVLPLLQGVRLSFSAWFGAGPIVFTGLDNYRSAFTSDFGSTLLLTAKFSLLCTAGIMILATLMAAAVSAGVKGSAFYRAVWFLPGIAPIAAVAVFWTAAFQPNQGAVNIVLGALGLGKDHAWLASSSAAIYPPIFVTIWASVGFAFLLMLGAMEQIPVSVYEAARIDGASAVRSFFHITLPLAFPVLSVTTLLELIWSFNGFTALWAMTKGGPGFATSILPVEVYKQAFEQTNFGLASAMALIGGAILIAVGVLGLQLSNSRQ